MTDNRTERQHVRRRAKLVKAPVAEFKGFLNYPFTKAENIEIKTLAEDPVEVSSAWKRLVEDGFSISTRFDNEEQCFLATAFMRDPDNPAAGIMLSCRASLLPRAVVGLGVQWKSMQYDHTVLAGLFANQLGGALDL